MEIQRGNRVDHKTGKIIVTKAAALNAVDRDNLVIQLKALLFLTAVMAVSFNTIIEFILGNS